MHHSPRMYHDERDRLIVLLIHAIHQYDSECRAIEHELRSKRATLDHKTRLLELHRHCQEKIAQYQRELDFVRQK